MKILRNGLIKNVHYLCLAGVIALGLMTIIASNGCGGDDSPTPVAPPSAPSGIYGTWYNDGISDNVMIVWAKVDGATGYNVYESVDNVNFTQITTSPTPMNKYYTDNSNEDLAYYVTAVSPGGESTPSDVVLAILSQTNHDGMTGISPADGEYNVSTSPTFSWDPYPGAAKYVVWVRGGNGFVWEIRVPSLTTVIPFGSISGDMIMPPTENPLLNDTTYTWIVMAINSDNWCIANNRGAGGHPDEFTTAP